MTFGQRTKVVVIELMIWSFLLVYLVPFATSGFDFSRLLSWRTVWIILITVGIHMWIEREIDNFRFKNLGGFSMKELRTIHKDTRKEKRRDPKW